MSVDISSITETKYFKYLLENHEAIDAERDQFDIEFSSMIKQKTDEMSVVLKCHLISEYYIDKYLRSAFPSISAFDELKLSFSHKLKMIHCNNSHFSYYNNAITELNRLRNKFAHNLAYTICDNDIKEMKNVMYAWADALEKDRKEGVSLIVDFVVWYCSGINTIICEISRNANGLGVMGYLKWLHEITQENNLS